MIAQIKYSEAIKMSKSKLEVLTEKRNQLTAQIQAIKAKEQTQKRKDETRKKIIIGGVILKMVKNGKMSVSDFNNLLIENIESERDRKLFDLD